MSEKIFSKIRGVSYENRQELIKKLVVGQHLQLYRDLDNKYDDNAIAVYCGTDHLGFINKNMSPKLIDCMKQGKDIFVVVEAITGMKYGTYGVNIKIEIFEKSELENRVLPDISIDPYRDLYYMNVNLKNNLKIFEKNMQDERKRCDDFSRFLRTSALYKSTEDVQMPELFSEKKSVKVGANNIIDEQEYREVISAADAMEEFSECFDSEEEMAEYLDNLYLD